MLDIKLISDDPKYVKEALAKKGCEVDFTELLSWVAERKKLLQEVEQDKAQRNKVSAEIPKLKKQGLPVDDIFAKMRALGDAIT